MFSYNFNSLPVFPKSCATNHNFPKNIQLSLKSYNFRLCTKRCTKRRTIVHCGRNESALTNGFERTPIFWALVLFLYRSCVRIGCSVLMKSAALTAYVCVQKIVINKSIHLRPHHFGDPARKLRCSLRMSKSSEVVLSLCNLHNIQHQHVRDHDTQQSQC